MKIRVLLLIAAVSFTCARPKPKPEAKWPPRVKNSAPERSDALTAAGTPRNMEVEQQRWGVEAAENLKRNQKEQAQRTPGAVIPMPPPNEDGRRPDAGARDK